MGGVIFDKILGRIREGDDGGGGGGGGTSPKTITVHDINHLLDELTDAQMDDLHVGDIIHSEGNGNADTYWFALAKDHAGNQDVLKLMRFLITFPRSNSEKDLEFDMRQYTRYPTPVVGRLWLDNGEVSMLFSVTHNWGSPIDALVREDWAKKPRWWKNGDFVQATDGLYLLAGSSGDPTRRFIKVDADAVTEVIYEHDQSVYYNYSETRTTYLRHDTMVSTTYAELASLRAGGNLVPGTWYRITDYDCTTSATGTDSANHAFDIIVRADDESHLNENAYAAHHEGDNYFANCKLEAWELKYSLDNDTSRFGWADTNGGKGVVFWMRDEFGNEAPYDFKNIRFARRAVADLTSSRLTPEALQAMKDVLVYDPNDNPFFFGLKNSGYSQGYLTFVIANSALIAMYYTFGGDNDESLQGHANRCYDNVIKPWIDDKGVQQLNNGVWVANGGTPGHFHTACGTNCHDWTCGNGCYNWTCGNDCYNWTCGNDCNRWICGNSCYNWTCGNGCYMWTCSDNCYQWNCGTGCTEWSCGLWCSEWTCGNRCSFWSCMNDCFNWNCGNNCMCWSCGNTCAEWSCGNGCNYWSCGNDCVDWSCGDNCRNFHLLNSASGNLTGLLASNTNYSQYVGNDSNGNLRVWVPADMAAP